MCAHDPNISPRGSRSFDLTLSNGTSASFTLNEYRIALPELLETEQETLMVLNKMDNVHRIIAYNLINESRSVLKALQHLPEMAVFCAEVAKENGSKDYHFFTFAEWLGWFELYDKPLSEKDQESWFLAFCAESANDSRILAWQKISKEWRVSVLPEDDRRRRSHEILQAYQSPKLLR